MTSRPQRRAPPQQISGRCVLKAVLDRGPISRAELARFTGLSKQTTSAAICGLERSGWVGESGRTRGAIGRAAVTYEVKPDAAFLLGIDLGGTKIRIGLANLLGTIVAEATEPTDPRGGSHVLEQIGAIADAVLRQHGVGRASLHGAAMASPGVLDKSSGAIRLAPNIAELDRIDVPAVLERRLGCALTIENDVSLAAFGEQWLGGRHPFETFAFVALGTGIGMGLVIDGRLVRGAHGAAGEIAYLPVGSDPFDSRTHLYGPFESAVGSEAIVQRYRGFGGTGAADVREVFDRLAEAEPAAIATIDETARVLMQGMMAIRALIDPERIVLGGSIGIRTELIERLRSLAARYLRDPLPIEPSVLGNRAALLGAIAVALAQARRGILDLPAGDIGLPPQPAGAGA